MIRLLFVFCISALTLQCSQMGDRQQKLNEMFLCECSQGAEASSLKLFLEQGVDINYGSKEKQGATALHIATEKNFLEIVKFLLEQESININSKKNDGATSLHIAASQGHIEIAEVLIKKGADINAACLDGRTALHVALQKKHEKVAKLFLEQKSIDVNASYALQSGDKKVSGLTPLHIALLHKISPKIIKKLTDLGANPNAKTGGGFTPISLANPIVQKLLKQLCNPESVELEIEALHIATANNFQEAVEYILNRKIINANAKINNGLTALHEVRGNYKIADFLIQSGAEVDATTPEKATPLHYAAQEGHEKTVELLIEKGANINAAYYDGATALHFALHARQMKVVEFLLKQKSIDVNASSTSKYGDQELHGVTPLHLAASYQLIEIIKKLVLDHKAEVNVENSDKVTPLHHAVQRGNKEIAEFLIQNGAHINVARFDGKTALLLALLDKHTEIVKLLLEQESIDVNASCEVENISGFRPLHIVARYNGAVEIAKKLIEKGAEINATCADGRTALHLALQYKHEDLAKFLLKQKTINIEALYKCNDISNISALHIAAANGLLEIAKNLLEKGAEINGVCSNGQNVLLWALQGEHEELAEFFLEQKSINTEASYELNNTSGITALHVAARKGFVKTIKKLLEKGLDINLACSDGCTALHFTLLYNHEEAAKFLLEQKLIDVNAPCTLKFEHYEVSSFRPLHIAAKNGLTNMIKELACKGATINDVCSDGRTALHFALLYKHEEAAKFLLSQEFIDVNAPFSLKNTPEEISNFTALHVAVRNNGSLETVEKLIEKGAKINAACRDGRTALHFAVQYQRNELIKFLLKQESIAVNELCALKNAEGEISGVTALHLAAETGDLETAKTLLEKGANKHASDSRGTTPLDIMRAKCPELISLLSASPSTPRKLSHEKLA